jgi:RimJ/RimL family protein N-acetyltransferase
VLFDADDLVSHFVAARVQSGAPFPPDTRAMGLVKDGEVVGGAVFHSYRGHDIEVAFALDDKRALTRRALYHFFAFPFMTAGCVRATARTSAANQKARNLLRSLGCRLEGEHPLGHSPTEDAVTYGMLKSDCRWLKEPK